MDKQNCVCQKVEPSRKLVLVLALAKALAAKVRAFVPINRSKEKCCELFWCSKVRYLSLL